MPETPFKTVLVDYDDDLFPPPAWLAPQLAAAGIEFAMGQDRTPESALAAARAADVVLIQSVRKLLTGAVIEQLPRCLSIVRLGIGFDSVDIPTATRLGIAVSNAPTYCVDDVADHALALLVENVRHVARQDRWIRAGRWDRTGALPARRMKGRTLGFLGFGRIARALAERVAGFGMTLVAYDPYVSAEHMARYGASKVEFDELLRQSDFITIHSPLTPETRHILDSRAFGLMQDGVIIVNTSRGPIIDEAALADALRAGKVWGAGLDVMETEPLPAGSPLLEFETVTLTPHVSAASADSVDDLYRVGYEVALAVQAGQWPTNVVNPESQQHPRWKALHL